MGPPVPGRGRGGLARPELAAAPLAAPDEPRRSRPRILAARASGGTARTASARSSACRPRRSTGSSRRRGFSRLRDADRVTAAPVRYVACHPGALVHQDHKKLGRIPDGGGWRVLGRRSGIAPRPQRRRLRPLEVVIDDASRYARRRPGPRRDRGQRGRTRSRSLPPSSPRLGIRIERVLTDNGCGVPRPTPIGRSSSGSAPATSGPGPTGRRPTARPSGSSRRCSTSGRMPGRTGRTPSARRPSRRSSTSTIERRPHTALGGLSPLDVVNNVPGDHS